LRRFVYFSLFTVLSGTLWAADKPVAKDDPRLRHWAFQSPVRPELPKVKNDAWVRNSIDRFILTRLDKEGLKPSPEADPTTLIRRLSLDLIGLPPTPEEVDAFVKEYAAKPQAAYAALVERLLASPHYGERWARIWLDAARYADSDGFEKDKMRQVWFYREWVINALNRDLPYNQFVVEQVAGDLLPNATQDQRVATGYLRNSMLNEEGGIDPEQFRMEAMFDRMDAIGKGVLGLTIQCCQCHNHKYDPISQVEYYRMFAFLNSCHEANVAAYTPDEQRKRAEIFRKIKAIEEDLKHKQPDWQQKMREWETEEKASSVQWTIVRPEFDASGGQKHYVLDDGSILAQGYAPTKHTTDFTVKLDAPKIAAVRLEVRNDPNLPLNGPGRSIKGLFALSEFKVTAQPADKSSGAKELTIVKATADVNPPERDLETIFDDRTKTKRVTGPILYAIDKKNETAWTTDIGPGRSNVPRNAVFVFDKPIENPKGTLLTFKLAQNHGGWNSDDNQNNNLGRFRFAVTDNDRAKADPLPPRVRELLNADPGKRTASENDALFASYRTTVADWREANEQIEALWKEHPIGSSQLVLEQRDMPRPTHVLKRGDFLKPEGKTDPGVPAILHRLPNNASADRLTFAKWLVDRQSPTTARSLVNRIWQSYFGLGIVASSEDLGTQSEPPTHPELLDWLAVEFMEPGDKSAPWSIKHLHRLIVLSSTYRQSSKVTPQLASVDPENRLLARGPRFRVDAEVVRDIALAASGLLNPKIGGRSVFPPLPAFMLLPPVSYGPKQWPEDKGAERYRRALYTFRFRSLPYPTLQAFDAPNGDFACVRRPRSNTPLQALMTLNEPVFVECARALAMKTMKDGGPTDADRMTYAFRRCLSRSPGDTESKALLELLMKQKAKLADPDAKPWELAAADPKNPPELPKGMRPFDAAAWTVVARVLLNLDETITKE
jgi:Protein of unknown function (DUF1553)/Protein of unknown function (DUF1549)